MLKTSIDIERDFFSMIKDSSLGKAIAGKVYRSNMRPPSSVNEDIVVFHIAGIDSQIQTGVVLANIYTKPKRINGVEVDDKVRCAELMRLFYDMIEQDEPDYDYSLETDGSPRINYDTTAKQYVISCRIRYTRLDI